MFCLKSLDSFCAHIWIFFVVLLDDDIGYKTSCLPTESLDFDGLTTSFRCFDGKSEERRDCFGFHCLNLLIRV